MKIAEVADDMQSGNLTVSVCQLVEPRNQAVDDQRGEYRAVTGANDITMCSRSDLLPGQGKKSLLLWLSEPRAEQ